MGKKDTKWWDDMSPLEQAEYHLEHPKSKMPKGGGKANLQVVKDSAEDAALKKADEENRAELKRIMEEGKFDAEYINVRLNGNYVKVNADGVLTFNDLGGIKDMKLRIKALDAKIRQRPDREKLLKAAQEKVSRQEKEIAKASGIANVESLPSGVRLSLRGLALTVGLVFGGLFLHHAGVDASMAFAAKGGLLVTAWKVTSATVGPFIRAAIGIG